MSREGRGGALLSRLRAQGAHYRRRHDRMGLMALGGRVDFTKFAESRAFVEGLAVAYEEALEIIGDGSLGKADIDPCVIELARQGLHVDAIASRCGCDVRVVAENLVRYVHASLFAEGQS